ncbi:MAG: O-antigen ligase family protein [Bdellovibrionales bacterium]|nr:O-antigen ligase family protein [Bdellovibrionales bacterium]
MHLMVGAFLTLVSIEVFRFLFKRYGFKFGWMRIPIPIFFMIIIGIAAMTGLVLVLAGPSEVLLAIGLGSSIFIGLFHPVAAAAVLISNVLVRPWENYPDREMLGILPRMLAGISMLTWIAFLFLRKNFSFRWCREMTLISLLFCWLMFSALTSFYYMTNFNDITRAFIPIVVVCFLVVNVVENELDLAVLTKCFMISLTGVIAIAIPYTVLDPLYATEGLRLQGMGQSGNSNDLAAFGVLGFPFALMPFIRARRKKTTAWVELICMLIMLVGVMMTKSRAGAGALAASLLLYQFMISKDTVKLIKQLILISPVILAVGYFATQRDASDLAGSSDSRLNYIITGFLMLKAYPLMGVGVGNYPRFYEMYSPLFTETGERTAHSTWMLLLSETGPVGFAIFAYMFFRVCKTAWEIRKTYPEFIMSLLGYGIAMSMLSHSYSLYPYLLIFLAYAGGYVLKKNPDIKPMLVDDLPDPGKDLVPIPKGYRRRR